MLVALPSLRSQRSGFRKVESLLTSHNPKGVTTLISSDSISIAIVGEWVVDNETLFVFWFV